MTVQDLVIETYEALAEPSDLFPYLPGTTTFGIAEIGTQKILKWINRAYKRILNWKFPNGSQVRFPSQEGEIFFKSMVLSGTAAAGSSTTITLDSAVLAIADQYNGAIIEITGGTGSGQVRMIVDFTALRVATVHDDWDTPPDVTSTYSVYKRTYKFRGPFAADVAENIPLSPIREIAAIRKITDVEGLSDLVLSGRLEDFTSSLTSHGVPSSYIPKGDGLVFDIAPDETIWYKLEYQRIAPEMTLASDEPELPDSFNEALLLYTQWIGLRRAQEWGGAYSTKKDIEDIMASLKTALEMSFEREDIGAFYE